MVDLDAFTANGFHEIDATVLREIGDAARREFWAQLESSPDDPGGWTRPVVWAADLTGRGPFGELMRSTKLAAALDAVCGIGGWRPRGSLGNVPVRFPVPSTADDRGWHVDLNTPGPDGSWSVSGRPHTVLLLTILSEVGPDDAPTRIRIGSHRDIAAVLDDRTTTDTTRLVAAAGTNREVALATGLPGDMYLVHPFTVHAADEHRGSSPRFMAQAPVLLTEPVTPDTPTPLASAWQ